MPTRARTPPGSTAGATPMPASVTVLDALLAAEPALTPYDVAGAVARALPREGLLVVGASTHPRPRPDGAALRGRGSPQDPREPRAVRHRRRRLDRHRRGPRPALGPEPGTGRRRDLPARLERPGPRTRRAAPRPHARRGQRRRRLHLRDPRAGRREYADRYERLFGTPHGVDLASLCAATRTPHLQVRSRPELEQVLASPNGGIEVSRPSAAATTGALSTPGSGPSRRTLTVDESAPAVPLGDRRP